MSRRADRARCRAPTRPSCSSAFDLPIALMQDAEALERIAAELVETKAADGVRYVEIRWGPLLHVARGLALADGIAAVCARRAGRGAPRTGTGRPAHRDGAPLARPRGQRHAGRDRGPLPRPGADRLGPGRARGVASRIRWPTPPRSRPPGRAACGSPSMPASGAARAQVRRALELEPERIAHGPGAVDDPELCAELIARRVTLDLCPTSNWQAGIVPSLAEHPLARLAAGRRLGHAQHRRHDGLRHHAVRGVPQRRRDDRADRPRAVGDRPPRARRRVRRRGRPRAAAGRVRRPGVGPDPGTLERAASRIVLSRRRALQRRGQLGGVGRDRGRLLGRRGVPRPRPGS